MEVGKVQARGQITLPRAVRKAADIKPGDLIAMKVTGPVGITVGDVIVAVNVTACPCFDGFRDEMIVAELVVC